MSDLLIKNIPVEDRPRERFLKVGVNNLSNNELISILLNTGTKNSSVKELADNILKELNDITQLKDLSLNSLKKIKGIGEIKAITLISALELGKRVYYEKNMQKIKMNSAGIIYDYIKSDLIGKKQEYFYCLYLDTKKNLIEKKLLFIGTINRSIVHPREIFKNAYLLSASSIVCIHNHPSGDPLPSIEDINLTKSLVKIGKIQGIEIIDHIIIGNNYYSFFENGDI